MDPVTNQIVSLCIAAKTTANQSITFSNASLGKRSAALALPLVKQAANAYSSARVTLDKAQGIFNASSFPTADARTYAAGVITNTNKFLGGAWNQLQQAEKHLQSLPKAPLPIIDTRRRGVRTTGVLPMNPQKMFARVGPMLTPRGLHYLAGASAGTQAALLSGVDVGVVLANIEGLAGFAEAHGLTLDGMVQIGSVALGDYSSSASTAGAARAAALNANSESAKAKAATTRADAQPHLVNAQQFIQSAITKLGAAMNDYNGTDPASDPNGFDVGVAQGAIASAQNAIAGAQANFNAAAAYAQSLPAAGGGGTAPPPPGPPPPTPEPAKSSMNWWLVALGLAAGGVIIWAVSSDDKAKGAHHKALAA